MKRYTPSLLFTLVLLTSTAVAQWTNNQNAQYVIGQPDFTTYSYGSSQTELYNPMGVALDLTHGKLYVSDFDNNRIVRYSYPILASQPSANLVFGQADFTGCDENRGGPPAANTMSYPWGIAVSNGDLWVADHGNNRVIKFSRADTITQNGPDADVVLGQADFTHGSANRGGSTSQNGMYSPAGVFVDGSGRLWISEMDNNRVLRFDNASSKPTGANADSVLGQPDFTSQSAHITQNGMHTPVGIWVSGTTLWVSDRDNNRVLRFDNAAGKSNGSDADGVLGQEDFTSGAANTPAANTFNTPVGICVDGSGRLYVTDDGNCRVMIFNNASGKSNGTDADNRLGQSDWITSAAQSGNNGFFFPTGITVDNTNAKLFVCEASNNRVMQFLASSALPVQLTSFVAFVVRSQALLSWSTVTETSCYGFEVERKSMIHQQSAMSSWIKVGFVKGSGTNNSPHEYSFSDNTVSAGSFAYRLKQIDHNGSSTYSQEIQVTIEAPKIFFLNENYPNPFNPTTTITFTLAKDGYTSLKVFDILGREVTTLVNETLEAGVLHQAVFNASQFTSGIYFLCLESGGTRQIRKSVLMK